MLRRLGLAFCILVLAMSGQSSAQSPLLVRVVTTCGTVPTTYAAGQNQPAVMDVNGQFCTNATSGGATAVTIADGADVTQGAKADAVCATATGTCSLIALQKYNNSTNPILGAGSAIIGKVGIDQTTPGTTNAVASTPVASEIHVGEVGGNIIVITNAMTTSNNAIAAGESVGGIQTLTGAARVSGAVGAAGTGGLIQSVVVSFKDVVVATSLDVWFFNAALAGATCADNTNFTLANGDRPKVIYIAHLTDINGTTTVGTAPTFAQAGNLAAPFSLSSATSILACVVNRGATFTPADTTGATIQVTVLRN